MVFIIKKYRLPCIPSGCYMINCSWKFYPKRSRHNKLYHKACYIARPDPTTFVRELEHKSRLVDWHSDTRYNRYVLFSRSGFTEKIIQTAKKEKVLLVHGEKVLK